MKIRIRIYNNHRKARCDWIHLQLQRWEMGRDRQTSRPQWPIDVTEILALGFLRSSALKVKVERARGRHLTSTSCLHMGMHTLTCVHERDTPHIWDRDRENLDLLNLWLKLRTCCHHAFLVWNAHVEGKTLKFVFRPSEKHTLGQ